VLPRPSRVTTAISAPRTTLRAVRPVAIATLAALAACSHAPEQAKQKPAAAALASTDPSPASHAPPSFLRYPRQGSAIEPWVQEQVELADATHERVLVYVGATWCEPCRRFHEAVQRGELNGTLNGLRFLEFDQDQDAPALKTAGYAYEFIPVLALPDPDGRNHGRMISGSIKGPSAVKENLVPRLQALLSGKAVD
jgi:thiol-disulfide isomerase/thioredoxin